MSKASSSRNYYLILSPKDFDTLRSALEYAMKKFHCDFEEMMSPDYEQKKNELNNLFCIYATSHNKQYRRVNRP